MSDIALVLALGFTMLTAITAWMLLRLFQDQDRLGVRMSDARAPTSKPRANPHNHTRDARRGMLPENPVIAVLRDLLGKIGHGIARSGIMPRTMIAELERTLSNSGLTSSNALGTFVGSKLLLFTSLPLLVLGLLNGMIDAPNIYGVAVAAAAAGLMAPDWFARRLRRKYIERVQGGLPDALDLLLICAQSGLALESGMSRVEYEMRSVHPDLAWEFAQTVAELQIVSDSRVALANLGSRTGLDGLRRLSSTLIQTMQFGTPLSDALRMLAGELRTETMMAFEAKAARLPVLLTLPMVVFILPTVFIVVGGPAVIQLIRGFMS